MMTTGRVPLVAAILCASVACASSRDTIGSRAPNPNGCYVQVWDAPNNAGLGDYINGPAKLVQLQDLPGQRSWRNKIRSLRVGPAASVTVWSDENFGGNSLRLVEVEYMQLPDALSGKIESMQIACTQAAR
jgi:hypothetical protein